MLYNFTLSTLNFSELSLMLTSSFKLNPSQLSNPKKRSMLSTSISNKKVKESSHTHVSNTEKFNDTQDKSVNTEFVDNEIQNQSSKNTANPKILIPPFTINDLNISPPFNASQNTNFDHTPTAELPINDLMNELPIANPTTLTSLTRPFVTTLNDPVIPRNLSTNVPSSVLQTFNTTQLTTAGVIKKIIVKSIFKVPFVLNPNEISYVLSKCKDKGNKVIGGSVNLPLTFPPQSRLFKDEASMKQLNEKAKEQFLKFSARYKDNETHGNNNLCPNKLLAIIDKIRRDLLQKLAAEHGIKKETKTMTEFLSDRSIISDDSSTLPFPYYLRGNICKLAKFIQSDDDIPSEKYMQENLIQCGLVNDSTLDKGMHIIS